MCACLQSQGDHPFFPVQKIMAVQVVLLWQQSGTLNHQPVEPPWANHSTPLQVVEHGGLILEKPADAADALSMLRRYESVALKQWCLTVINVV